MSTITSTQPVVTSKGVADGISLKWDSFSLLLIGAPKGFLACCIFDLDMINRFQKPCAMVESGPDNPIGTIDRMVTRTISRVNDQAAAIGITVGMASMDALELLF
jgi:uncharacterized protein YunC (DUF1805 family)